MYLVEFQQGERQHTVGLFKEKKEAEEWIEACPYTHKESELFEGEEFVTYTMKYEELPLYEEIVWKKVAILLQNICLLPMVDALNCLFGISYPL